MLHISKAEQILPQNSFILCELTKVRAQLTKAISTVRDNQSTHQTIKRIEHQMKLPNVHALFETVEN